MAKKAAKKAAREELEKERKERLQSGPAHSLWLKEYSAQRELEIARLEALSPEERLKESGKSLLKDIETDPQLIVALEVSASERAKCRAGGDCLRVQVNRYGTIAITDEHRICVRGVSNRDWFGRTKHYYHVACFEHMVDLKSLLPSKFKMDPAQGRMPLMVELWFHQQGCIDLDKIGAYFDALDLYDEAEKVSSAEYIEWQVGHNRKCGGKPRSECECPPQPSFPEEPILRKYKTGKENPHDLVQVLQHPGCRYARGITNPKFEDSDSETESGSTGQALSVRDV
jgi:hypothetical protein